MILIDLVQHLTFADITSWQIGHDLLSGLGQWHGGQWHGGQWHGGQWHGSLAALFNTDVFAGTRAFFNNFMKSGQAWALAIGVIFGYIFRALTTYG